MGHGLLGCRGPLPRRGHGAIRAQFLLVAYIWLHRIIIPVTWPWVLLYGAAVVGFTEGLHAGSATFDPSVPIHIEVLLPAFVLGCIGGAALGRRLRCRCGRTSRTGRKGPARGARTATREASGAVGVGRVHAGGGDEHALDFRRPRCPASRANPCIASCRGTPERRRRPHPPRRRRGGETHRHRHFCYRREAHWRHRPRPRGIVHPGRQATNRWWFAATNPSARAGRCSIRVAGSPSMAGHCRSRCSPSALRTSRQAPERRSPSSKG